MPPTTTVALDLRAETQRRASNTLPTFSTEAQALLERTAPFTNSAPGEQACVYIHRFGEARRGFTALD